MRIQSRFVPVFLAAVMALAGSAARTEAQTIFTPLHSFAGGAGGAGPYAGLLLSGSTLYGTTPSGGTKGDGIVFSLNTNGTGFTPLYDFTNGIDGAVPEASLILSGDTLYGTAYYGGGADNGTIFSLKTNGTGFTPLYGFSKLGVLNLANSDGANPYGSLVLAGNRLYGTASGGGAETYGTVFSLNTDGTGFTNLHSFTGGTDGGEPYASLVLAGANLYGVGYDGGAGHAGNVFALNTNSLVVTTLYSFTNGTDGASPEAVVLAGNMLYGTASAGGAGKGGTVFGVTTNGTGFVTIYGFTNGIDGTSPQSGLLLWDHILYGTTSSQGGSGNGTVFGVNTNGTGFTILHGFTATSGHPAVNLDGAAPEAGFILPSTPPLNRITLFGTAAIGGGSGDGTVFSVQPPPPATADITWAAPAAIIYGTVLGSNQLDASANVAGTFVYTPAAGTLLAAGSNQTLSVTFMPTDNIDFTNVSDAVTINVEKATPVVTWSAPADITYGTALGFSQLDANATVAGAFVYSPPAGTVLDGGSNQTLSVTFTPTDTANYSNVTATVAINVHPAAPVVTWGDPLGITYGTALSASQLDAVANVPGSFAYTPANGSILNAGTNTLSVVFTPTSTADYRSATNTVSLEVSRAALTVAAANGNRNYGQPNPVFTGTIVGLTNGDTATVNYACGAISNSPVGMFAIVPSVAPSFSLTNNYVLMLQNGQLTVNPAPLTVTASAQSKTYGQALVFGGGSALFGSSGLQNGESIGTVTLAVSGNGGAVTASVANSPYTITPSGATGGTFAAGNYAITYGAGALTVNPAGLTVTANNRSKSYGQTVTFAGTEFGTAGLTNGDSVSSVTLTSLGAAMAATTAGSPYHIVPSAALGSGLSNYTITYADGLLTVNQAVPQVIWTTPAPIIYGAALSAVQLDATANVPGSFAYTPANGIVFNAGSNALSALFTPTDMSDYTNVTAKVTLVVMPAPLTVTVSNANRSYGATNPAFTGTIFGLTNGDAITVTFSPTATTATTHSPAGPYAIAPTLIDPGDRLGNYTVTTNFGTLTVTAVPLTATANNASRVYGAANPAFTGTVAGLVNGDNITALYTTIASAGSPVGNYPIVTDLQDPNGKLGNYMLTVANGMLVVSAAPLMVTVSNASRPYGLPNPAFTGTISGLENGDNITATYNCAASSNSPVGMYPIMPILSDPNGKLGDYSVTTNLGQLTVTAGAPLIQCPADITTNSSLSECGQIVSFTELVTGAPAPVVTCQIGAGVISSPYQFPIGLSVVNCTASNSAGVAQCQFTVTVIDTTPPVAGSNTLSAMEGKTASVTVTNLLLADQSPRGGTLSIPSVSPTSAAGGAVGLAGGLVSYTPSNGFAGPDVISYTLSDGCGTTQGLIAVTVKSTNPPVFQELSLKTGFQNSTLSGLAAGEIIVLQSSPNGINWTPIQTNTAGGGTLQFTDAISLASPLQLFRVVVAGGTLPGSPPVFQQTSQTAPLWIGTLSGLVTGETIVVQTSADGINWTPIQTNTAGGATLMISNVFNRSSALQLFRAVVP